MSLRIEILDGISPFLDQVAYISEEAAKEMLSVAGHYVKQSARNKMKQISHHWVKDVSKKGRVIYKKDMGQLRELGRRYSDSDASALNPDSMANFINSYLMEDKFTMVIGGKHKTDNKVVLRKDGKRVGYTSLKGIGTQSFAIIDKLNQGGTISELEARTGYKKSKYSFQNSKKDLRFEGFKFMQKGYAETRGSVENMLTERYKKLVHKSLMNTDIKVVKRSVS